MITKYDLFLILEANIKGSTEFLDRLVKISNQNLGAPSNIAQHIVNAISWEVYLSDKETVQNYFDIGSDDDKLSFLQSNKYSGNIDPYSMPGRNEIGVGRIIRKLVDALNIKVSNKDIEDFVNIFKATAINKNYHFELVNGKEIAEYYHNDKLLFSDSGSLGGSCMVNMPKSVFKIYSENPEKVSMLVYLNGENLLLGRAIIWKMDESPCEATYFMDRVYTCQDSDYFKFVNYAKEQGWLYKKYNGACSERENILFIYNDKPIYGEVKVKLDGNFQKYPFVDTLLYLSHDKDELSNLSSKRCFELSDADDHKKDKCFGCGGKIIDDAGNLCDYCGDGHVELYKYGIITDIYKKYMKKQV